MDRGKKEWIERGRQREEDVREGEIEGGKERRRRIGLGGRVGERDRRREGGKKGWRDG